MVTDVGVVVMDKSLSARTCMRDGDLRENFSGVHVLSHVR